MQRNMNLNTHLADTNEPMVCFICSIREQELHPPGQIQHAVMYD